MKSGSVGVLRFNQGLFVFGGFPELRIAPCAYEKAQMRIREDCPLLRTTASKLESE